MIASDEFDLLKQRALLAREQVIRLSGGGGCFLGASLSCVDIIVYLYAKVLNIRPENHQSPERDYFFLSKGHDVPALYAVLSQLGFLDPGRLRNHLKTNDFIYWHPNRNIPGIEFHSGSLGHLLSVALGVAYDCKIAKSSNKIFVILGDGELNEGSVWEAVLISAALKADNLVAIIDRNMFQANMRTEELIPLESIERKFEAFGWASVTCNGHDFQSLHDAFSLLPLETGRPTVVIADTIRGKGLPSIQARADRWFCKFSDDELVMLIEELYQGKEAIISSETWVVR